jgi:DnaJ-class molecular chaperone
MKNHYLILGVDFSATGDEIKTAYRHHAKALHPDYYGQDAGPFLDLQEAYATLSDPARRRAYDSVLRGSDGRRVPREPSPKPFAGKQAMTETLIPAEERVNLGNLSLRSSFQTFGPLFDELLSRLLQNFELARPKVERHRSLDVAFTLTPDEARRGGRLRPFIPAQLTCRRCGRRGGVGIFECGWCIGSGTVTGAFAVNLLYPPGIANHDGIEISLERFGFGKFYVRAILRVNGRRSSRASCGKQAASRVYQTDPHLRP